MSISEQKLRRTISWPQGAALTIGAVLGSGVLILPVETAVLAGPASLVGWLLMGLFAVPLAMTMGSLGAAYPDAGGIASYARKAFGPEAGTITGWLFMGTVPVGAPIAALIGGNYIGQVFSLNYWQVSLIAALMLGFALFFNYRGINLTGKVQMGIVAAIAAILTAAVLAAFPAVEKGLFTPFAPHGWFPVGVSMTILFWAFVGWEMIVHLAEEFKNPARDIPLSLSVSLGLIIALYLSVAFVTVGTGAYLEPSNVAALASMVAKGWGPRAGAITAVLGFLVCYGTIHTYVAGFSRLVYAQSRQGDFPVFFSRLHPRFQTPHRVLAALAPVFFIVLALNYHFKFNLNTLMQWPCAIFIALYIIGMASALRILPQKGGRRYWALISLIMCLGVYSFTGWAGVYPFILGALGWFVGCRKKGVCIQNSEFRIQNPEFGRHS